MTRKEILHWAEETVDRIFHHNKQEVHTIKGWVVRDKCGNCWFCKFKPHKTRHEEWSNPFIPLLDNAFPQVKWSDKEPTRATLTITIEK